MNFKHLVSLCFLVFGIAILESCTDTKTLAIQTSTPVKASMTPKGSEKETATSKKVKAIMSKMTLVDKVGEMTQLSIDMISKGKPYNLKVPNELDKAKLKEVLLEYRVGSILNVGGYAYTKEQWQTIITRIQNIATKEKPTGIPVLYGIDAIHGANYTAGGTLFPQEINLAATWNPMFGEKMGEVTAYETRASGIPWNFSPVLDIGRQPQWPRFYETLGEDPVLATRMGLGIIKGNQGDDISSPYRVAACMKHFLGYSLPRTGNDRTQAWIPETQLREYVLPMFKAAIDAGAATVMINSGDINGIPVHANPKILIDLLRNELGFKGVAVSDWEDIKYLYTRHKVAKDYKESIKISINAGVDMSMVPVDLEFPKLLKELVEEGAVPMSRIDEAVERILTLKMDLGLFENTHYPLSKYENFACKEFEQASLEAAEESITLLKNEKGILPLSKNSQVVVTGPMANTILGLNGGWSRTWQGTDEKRHETNKPNLLQGIINEIGKERVHFVIDMKANHKAAVEKSDVIIIAIGEMPYTEKPGDIEHLDLDMDQQELVKYYAQFKKPIVLVQVQGRPRVVSMIEPMAAAIVHAGLPGNEGGKAIANILFGDINPSGRLPFTYPRYANNYVTYDHRGTDMVKKDFSNNAFNPQWEFGYGMSYTKFEYSDLSISGTELKNGQSMKISVTVKNTGKREGKEVVQLYIADKVASIAPSVKRLRGFEKINIKAGESKTVEFSIQPKELAFVNTDNKWVTEPGEFEVQIGGMKKTFKYIKNNPNR